MPSAADLQFLIGANAAQFNTTMAGVQRTARTAGAGVTSAFGAARRAGTDLMAAVRGLPAALAALGIGFSLGHVAQTIRDIADIGNVADRVGVTTAALQQLRMAAEETGAASAALDTSLQQFGKNVSEAATGGTSDFAKILRANSVELADSSGRLREQMDILGEYAELVRRAGSQQDRIRLLTAAFGDAGVALEGMFSGGEAGLRKLMQAQEAGVIPDDLVREAEELDRKYSDALNAMSAAWKKFVVSAVADAAELARGIEDAWKKIVGEGGWDFLAYLDKLRKHSSGWGLAGAAVEGMTESYRSTEGQIRSLTRELEKLEEMRNLQIEVEGDTTEIDAKLIRLRRELMSLKSGIQLAGAAESVAGSPATASATGEVTAGRTRLPTAADDEAAREAERRAEAHKRVVEALTLEWQQLGMTSEQQRVATELARAGVEAKSEQGQAIAHLVGIIEAEKRAQEALSAVMEDQRERLAAQREGFEYLGQSAEAALLSIVDRSASAGDALKRLAVQLAIAAAQAALLGQGPLAGLFGPATLPGGSISPTVAGWNGNAFGLFARGGVTDRPAIFGEGSMNEAAVPLPDGRRIPVDLRGAAPAAQAGAGQSSILIELSPELKAAILEEAAGQSLQIVERAGPGMARKAIRSASRAGADVI